MHKQDVLDFWFKETAKEQWFKKDDDFDETIRNRFGETVEAALSGKLNEWANDDDGALALIITLDQFARNLFRDSPKAFAGDPLALKLTLAAIEDGYLDRNEIDHRYFLLMPMMHSEEIEIQDASLPLFKEHAPEMAYDYAVKHRDIIVKFGRYPHRNEVLGRSSTPEEIAFLKEPGSSF